MYTFSTKAGDGILLSMSIDFDVLCCGTELNSFNFQKVLMFLMNRKVWIYTI